jgi:hypothetical protein
VAWVQTTSPSFTARHDASEDEDAVGVLELLEGTRDRLGQVFPALPEEVAVVLHGSEGALALAQPYLPVLRRLTAPAGRRYLAGWYSRREIHVLTPRALARRASTVPGSREMLMLAPAAVYAQLVVGHNNPLLPPPFWPANAYRYLRWAWLVAGAGQYFSGQIGYARPAIVRRLREGRAPAFPPGLRDAALLGGSVFDLLAREHGVPSAVALALTLPAGGSIAALRHAFVERPLAETEARWRSHLGRLAEP